MKKTILLTFAGLLLASLASAQTASYKLGWTQGVPVGTPQASILSYQYTLKVDNGAPVALVQTCTLLAAPSTDATCVAPLPLLTVGTHDLTLTVFSAAGSAVASPYKISPPNSPSGVSVIVTVTIP